MKYPLYVFPIEKDENNVMCMKLQSAVRHLNIQAYL
jgi:hypothetical protein